VRRAVHWVMGHDPLATKGEAKSADKTATQLPALIEGWARLCQASGADGLSTAQAIKVLENHPGDHELVRALLTESTSAPWRNWAGGIIFTGSTEMPHLYRPCGAEYAWPQTLGRRTD
jgi:hypothetical protein